MIKVLQCIDGLQRGGKERRLVELLKGLVTVDDVEVALVLLSKRVQYPEVYDLGFPIHFLPRRFRWDSTVTLRLASLCRAIRPDIIHAWGSFASICSIIPAKTTGARLAAGMITHAPLRSRLRLRNRIRAALAFPFADVVLANSKAGLHSYRAPPAKGVCIYNGFDFRRLQDVKPAAVVRQQLGVKTQWLVGMVATFSTNKDHATYLAAAQQLLEQGIDATFVAAGDGPTLRALRAGVKEHWRDRILFPGAVADVESLVNALDVGVLCTDDRVHGEGISNALLEYMAGGKPVLASAGGGTGELVEHGITGILLPPRDVPRLVLELRRLLEHEDIRTAMGEAGRARVREQFTLEHMVHRHLELYHGLAVAGGTSRTAIDELS